MACGERHQKKKGGKNETRLWGRQRGFSESSGGKEYGGNLKRKLRTEEVVKKGRREEKKRRSFSEGSGGNEYGGNLKRKLRTEERGVVRESRTQS